MTQRFTTIILTLLFLGILFGGLFQVSSASHLEGEMSGCSFMSSTQSICSMGALDHLAAWKDTFTTVIPTMFTLISLLALTIVFIATAPHILKRNAYKLPRLFRYYFTHNYTFPHRPLQELFSNGILHPKLH